jgi:uncharacterized membrane protein
MAPDNIHETQIQSDPLLITLKRETTTANKTETFVVSGRVASVDVLRGLVMIIMALDHVRAYLHFDSLMYSPTDLERTTPALFATRLITHLCAPTFILLAGTSAYFIAQRQGFKYTSFFLVTRGLWLILLQFTIIRFAWNFDPYFHYNSSNIISTIGFCMIVLAAFIRFRLRTIFIIGLIIVFGHNALDTVSFEHGSPWDVLWSFLHVKKLYLLGHNDFFLFLYPLLPWIGVMLLGYCLGSLYDKAHNAEERKLLLLLLGCSSLSLFFMVRWINYYGDPSPWTFQSNAVSTIMSFLNVEKYPPSFLFLCLTLGVSLVLLAILEGKTQRIFQSISLFGKVPLFYYVTHIFVIHIVATLMVILTGYPWQTMIFTGPTGNASPLLIGNFGLTLGQLYLCWLSIVLLLYPACALWYNFKTRNRKKWWVSYI